MGERLIGSHMQMGNGRRTDRFAHAEDQGGG